MSNVYKMNSSDVFNILVRNATLKNSFLHITEIRKRIEEMENVNLENIINCFSVIFNYQRRQDLHLAINLEGFPPDFFDIKNEDLNIKVVNIVYKESYNFYEYDVLLYLLKEDISQLLEKYNIVINVTRVNRNMDIHFFIGVATLKTDKYEGVLYKAKEALGNDIVDHLKGYIDLFDYF